MRLDDFDYNLPEELIAQTPLEKRDASRLMVIHRDRGTIDHRHMTDLPEYLHAGDLLVTNDTQVVPCRLLG
ncbi:MAG: S-adenosylmethionine:tRNA ribosyltransferase-isomerase, partial [Candidatus Eisenbacteria bacterium]|nr:S-adenosylmethionine:tRNA ribosyltransferase-isomerase [Candidatus Eisenbacteria bacterium]